MLKIFFDRSKCTFLSTCLQAMVPPTFRTPSAPGQTIGDTGSRHRKRYVAVLLWSSGSVILDLRVALDWIGLDLKNDMMRGNIQML